MKVDESGAPWPYEDRPKEDDPGTPTWACPGGECDCHAPDGESETLDHRILFFDGDARVMPGARCRVVQNGRLLNKDAPFADGKGGVPIKIPHGSRHLEVEWAPPDLPDRPDLPYRKLYHLDLGEADDDQAARRLHNMGFSEHRTLGDNIRHFQRTYALRETGRTADVATVLASFHDDGTIQPIPRGGGGSADRPRSHALALAGDGAPGDPVPPGGGPTGGVKSQGTVTAAQTTVLRVHVRTRAGRPLDGAEVTIDSGSFNSTKKTEKDGFATFTLTRGDFDRTQPPGWVTVKVKRRHHGPDPGPGLLDVKTGELEESAQLDPNGFSDDQPLMLPSHRGLPTILVDTKGRYLDIVLMDGGMARGAGNPGTPTRRLTAEQIQNELIADHVRGHVTLHPDSEFQFDHDAASGDLDPCTDKCTIKSPAVDRRVSLKTPTTAGILWLMLFQDKTHGWKVGSPDKADVIPGQRFTQETFYWQTTSLQALDQRHVVGLVRLSQKLLDHDIAVIYTIGVNGDSSREDTHGYGLALDFGGCANALPVEDAAKTKGPQGGPVRLGQDFLVFQHWGRVPMWDPATVAADPGDPFLKARPTTWKRLPESAPDDGTDFATADPKKKRLHYRLDPPPYQEPVPASADPALAADLAKVAPHFQKASKIFEDVYDFASREYSDDNSMLGPLPDGKADQPTPIDSPKGHFILHPDYPSPNTIKRDASGNPVPDPARPGKFKENVNGRGAHVNHHHFQLGPTNYKTPRTT
ncbi:MAG: hypothetical protein U0359_10750 [Byssovorax sp.]